MKSLEDVASLCVLRIALGALLCWEAILFAWQGFITRYYVTPAFHFVYAGFSWIHPWSGAGMYVHFFVLGLSALFVMLGFCYRLSIITLFLSFSYVFLLDQTTYLNHFYLVSLLCFILIFTDAHRDFSLDAKLHPQWSRRSIPSWSLYLLRAQVALVYFYAAVAKLNSDWLHGQPLRIWFAEAKGIPFIGAIAAEPWAPYFASYTGLAIDLLIPILLLNRRTRKFGFVIAVLFHALNSVLFDIGIFPPLMVVATALFFRADWPRRFVTDAGPLPPEGSPIAPTWRPWLNAGIAAYLAIQILFPLRHFLYPGNVSWTGEGSKFAWRMKLNNIDNEVSFWAVSRQKNQMTRQTVKLDYGKFLTKEQRDAMGFDPEMVRQFAHFLASQLPNSKSWEIHVRFRGALNGRPMQDWIDPTVDLAAEPWTFRHANWILPLNN